MRDEQHDDPEERAEDLAEDIVEHNRDPQTRREAFELELIDLDESELGEEIEVSGGPSRGDRPRSQ
jgi:hypothetical protein